MSAKPELIYMPPSPFSRRAKWALDAAGIDFSMSTYVFCTTYLGELPLRWRLGRLTGNITAPIMLTPREGGGNEVVMDSTAIARWADEHSRNNPGQLFPKEHTAEVERWVQAADNLLSLFRREVVAAGLANPRLLEAMLPQGLTGLSGMLARNTMARMFARMAVKYKDQDASAQLDQAVADLKAAHQLLTDNPNKLLLPASDSTTYADIALATALNKMAELTTKLPPQPASAVAGDTAAATAAASEGPQIMADYVPSLKPLLEEFAELMEWAAETTKQRWPAGPGVVQE